MQSAGAIAQDARVRRRPVSSRKAAAIYLMWGFLLAFRGIAALKTHSSHHSQASFVIAVCLPVLIGFVFCLLGVFLVFGFTSLGTPGYEEIADLSVEQQVRQRYTSDTDQLASLGFSYAFTSGEVMLLSRMLLIYPAIVLFRLRRMGAVVVFRGGKALLATPVLTPRMDALSLIPRPAALRFVRPLVTDRY